MNLSDVDADEVLREWRDSAFYWQKHLDTIRVMFAPLTQALIEDAGIVEGDSVLDVAGGSGEPSLTIAETVGPFGSVTFTDAVAEMVTAAQSAARRRGLKNISFRHCAADALPFENESFDGVVCRLGAMFFPDPLGALREMLRVTKHQGVVSLVVWGKSELNPFSYAITNVVERYFELPPADPNSPGAFRFAEHGLLADLLRKIGAATVKERVLRLRIATVSPEQREIIAAQVQAAVTEYFPNNKMNFPAQMIIVTGGREL